MSNKRKQIEVIEISSSDEATANEESDNDDVQHVNFDVDVSMTNRLQSKGKVEKEKEAGLIPSNPVQEFLKDRKKLEAERLERQAKRLKAEGSTSATGSASSIKKQHSVVNVGGLNKYTEGTIKKTVNVLTNQNTDTVTIEDCFGPVCKFSNCTNLKTKFIL